MTCGAADAAAGASKAAARANTEPWVPADEGVDLPGVGGAFRGGINESGPEGAGVAALCGTVDDIFPPTPPSRDPRRKLFPPRSLPMRPTSVGVE